MTRYDLMRDDIILIKKSDIFEMENRVGYAHSPRGIEHEIGCTHFIELKPGSRVHHVLTEELDGLHAHWIPKSELGIKKVLYSGPATIVFWNDGTKTVVKCAEGDDYTPEVGLAMAISKKVLGDRYSNVFRKYCVSDGDLYLDEVEVSVDENHHTVVRDLTKQYKKNSMVSTYNVELFIDKMSTICGQLKGGNNGKNSNR